VGARRRALEDMVNAGFWKGKRVLVTGHTGFKGSWLTLWLRDLGAEVTGFSDVVPTDPALYDLAKLSADCRDLRGDVVDAKALRAALASSGPEIVFHLAAQPLVRASYRDPAETWRVNVMGTLNLLDACRAQPSVKTIVVITTDKVYENAGHGNPFREDDPPGGHDPYSASKAACEILCTSWRRSFVEPADGHPVGLATARAGNVIGGGDFAAERLVPDLVRAKIGGTTPLLRYPRAVRPWQHVLEPLSGYLLLAEKLHGDARAFSTAFNFGPDKGDFRTVGELADGMCRALDTRWDHEKVPQPHEAALLRLDSSRAAERLGWTPRLAFPDTLRWTSGWYAEWMRGGDARALTLGQIREYALLPRPVPVTGALLHEGIS
jgi:CDP-glucose 4,6-dehydratase